MFLYDMMELESHYSHRTMDHSRYLRDPVNISPWMSLDRRKLFHWTALNLHTWTFYNIPFLIVCLKQQHRHSLKHHPPPLPQQPHLSLPQQPHLSLVLLGQTNMYTGLKVTLIIEYSLNSSLGGSNVATAE